MRLDRVARTRYPLRQMCLLLCSALLSDVFVPRMDRADDGFELRVDRAGSVGPLIQTPEGYWICDVVIAVPGVMTYQEGGKTIREFVPPSTLSDPEWLASLENQPVTVEHPKAMVTPGSMGRVRVGIVLAPVVWSDGAVRARLRIDDQRGIDAIQYQNKREVSPGYAARVDRTPGRDPVYGIYDRRQEQRAHGNHVALTEQGRAPAGAARLFLTRTDSADGESEEGTDAVGAPVLLPVVDAVAPHVHAAMMPPMPSAEPVVIPPVLETAPVEAVEIVAEVVEPVAPASESVTITGAAISAEAVAELIEAVMESIPVSVEPPPVIVVEPAPLPEIEVEVKVEVETAPASVLPEPVAPLPPIVVEAQIDSLPSEVVSMNPLLLALLASLALPTTGYADDAAGWAAVDGAIAKAKGGAAPVVAPPDPAKQAEIDGLKGKLAALEPELAAKQGELEAAKARLAELEGGAVVEEMIDAAMEAGPAPSPDAMVLPDGAKMDSAKATVRAARLGKIHQKVLAAAHEVSRLDSMAAPLKIDGFDKLGLIAKRSALVSKMDSKQAGQSDSFNQAFIAIRAGQVIEPSVKLPASGAAPVIRQDSAQVTARTRFRPSRVAINHLNAAHNAAINTSTTDAE